jgi:hypothetical protein
VIAPRFDTVPDSWEREHRQSIRHRIETLRPVRRKSQVPVTTELQNQMDAIPSIGLPSTIRFVPGQLTITCRDMGHLVEQLVLVAKALDSDYEGLQPQVESVPDHKPIDREHAARSGSKAG